MEYKLLHRYWSYHSPHHTLDTLYLCDSSVLCFSLATSSIYSNGCYEYYKTNICSLFVLAIKKLKTKFMDTYL